MTAAPPKSFESAAPSLTKHEIERFSRQIMVEDIGAAGMARIRASHVTCVGAGGLGSTIALYLVAAGIGHLTLIDFDHVEVSNLHRQVIHTHMRVGEKKVDSARDSCLALYPDADITAVPVALTAANAEELLRGSDVIVDGSDNVAARYLINDAAVRLRTPLVSGSAVRWEGQLTVYGYRGGPCYRCLFPQPPPPAAVGSCNDTGVAGPVPGMIGCLQALEVLKLITGAGEPLNGRMLVFDGLRMRVRIVGLRPRQAATCLACGEAAMTSLETETGDGSYSSLAALASTRPEYAAVSGCVTGGPAYSSARLPAEAHCSVEAFASEWCARRSADVVVGTARKRRRMSKDEDASGDEPLSQQRWPLCVDVRASEQFDMCHLPGSFSLPLAQLQRWAREESLATEWPKFLQACVELDAQAPVNHGRDQPPLCVFLLCRRGVASVEATALLRLHFHVEVDRQDLSGSAASAKLVNVDGGLNAYHQRVDKGFPYY